MSNFINKIKTFQIMYSQMMLSKAERKNYLIEACPNGIRFIQNYTRVSTLCPSTFNFRYLQKKLSANYMGNSLYFFR